jgi:hypothetical protein
VDTRELLVEACFASLPDCKSSYYPGAAPFRRAAAVQEGEAAVRQDAAKVASVMVTPATPLFPLPSKLTAVLVAHSRPRSTSLSRVLVPLMRAALCRPSSLRGSSANSVCVCAGITICWTALLPASSLGRQAPALCVACTILPWRWVTRRSEDCLPCFHLPAACSRPLTPAHFRLFWHAPQQHFS